MNVEYFIAKRIHFRQDRKNVSRPAVRIATIGIATGLAVMLLAISIVVGFKQEIRNKTIGFGGHIQLTNFDSNNSYEMLPVSLSDSLLDSLRSIPGVSTVSSFVTKPGIIKTADAFQGIVLKGVGPDFDAGFFNANITDGTFINPGDSLRNEAVISQHMAKAFQLKTGDSFHTYFIQDKVKARRFTVKGIYSTNFVEYDRLFIITDIRILQQLSGWSSGQVGGYELRLADFGQLEPINDKVYSLTSPIVLDDGSSYYTRTIREINPQIFAWLDLLDINVWVILALMLAVAGFNMISGLLILILERTSMIGILKSIGATNWSVRRIFLYHSFFLIGKGMIWGNIAGLSIITLQYFTGIIPLDPEAYYVSTVPVVFHWPLFLLLNAGTLVASVAMMIGPSYLITRILPAKIIRYE